MERKRGEEGTGGVREDEGRGRVTSRMEEGGGVSGRGVAKGGSREEAWKEWRGQKEDGDTRERVNPRHQAGRKRKVGEVNQYSFLCVHQGIEIQRVKKNLRVGEQKE